MSEKHIFVQIKDTFPLYDPHFSNELSLWLSYSVFDSASAIDVINLQWNFFNNNGFRSKSETLKRETSFTRLEKRYANREYVKYIYQNFNSKDFRINLIVLYDMYGAVLADDLDENVEVIYNENVFNAFSSYTSECGEGNTHSIRENLKIAGEQFDRESDSPYFIIQEILSLCN